MAGLDADVLYRGPYLNTNMDSIYNQGNARFNDFPL